MTAAAPGHAPPAERTSGRGGVSRRQRPRRSRLIDRIRRIGLPYLLLLPALFFELLVHLVPMVVGIAISFKQLTLFYIHNWQHAPWAGLSNYRLIIDFNAPVGHALLHSFMVTCSFTVLAVGFSWLLGTAAAILAQDSFRGR